MFGGSRKWRRETRGMVAGVGRGGELRNIERSEVDGAGLAGFTNRIVWKNPFVDSFHFVSISEPQEM